MHTITSSDYTLSIATTRLNSQPLIALITDGSGRSPIARLVNATDVPNPPAPAWYLPGSADIYIHVDESKIDPKPLADHWTIASTDFNVAKTLGLLCHEAAHAAISDGVAPAEKAAPHHRGLLTMLEELRVENHSLRKVSDTRRLLRASFTIILESLHELDIDNHAAVARAWGLICGRTLAGIATEKETNPLDIAARTLLGDDVVDELSDLVQEALTLSLPDDTARLIEICDEWVALVGTDPTDDGCAACSPDGSGAKGTPADGSGAGGEDGAADGSGAGGKESGAADASDGVGTGQPGAVGVAATVPDDEEPTAAPTVSDEGKDLVEGIIKDLTKDLAEEWATPDDHGLTANATEWAHKIFGNKRASSRLTLVEPTSKHRQDVVHVAGVLSNLMLPAVAKTARPSLVPPGKMRSREAVRASAERAQGQMVSAKPWKGTVRRHTTARPLVIGIATDTSGSMRWAQDAVAEFAYVYANAGHRIGARTAAVTFGSRVYRVARPGEVMNNVVVKPANDGSECCDYAIAALDGVLGLTRPSYSARILLVVSDGAFVRSGETTKVQQWIKQMDAVGTHVMWITDHDASARFWLKQAERRFPNFTVIAAKDADPDGSSYSYNMSFDRLNAAALSAISKHVR